MAKIERLNLDQILYFECCSLVPHGEIIQTTIQDRPVIGMRTFYNNPTGGLEAILVIGGTEHCLLASLDDLGNPPAVAVSKLVRLVATDILPFNPNNTLPQTGNLLQLPDGALIARSQVIHFGGVTQPTYVYLTDGQAKALKGSSNQSLSLVGMRGIARSFDLELQPEPIKVVAAA